MLKDLNYWNVELQEAYFSPKEVKERVESKKNNNLTSNGCGSISTDWETFLSDFLKYYSIYL